MECSWVKGRSTAETKRKTKGKVSSQQDLPMHAYLQARKITDSGTGVHKHVNSSITKFDIDPELKALWEEQSVLQRKIMLVNDHGITNRDLFKET